MDWNFVTPEFELVTPGFEVVTPGLELVTRGLELATRGFELVTRRFEFVTRNAHLGLTFPGLGDRQKTNLGTNTCPQIPFVKTCFRQLNTSCFIECGAFSGN